jgi:hypothetical protein
MGRFYERLFNFREIRYFDIEGQVTGVKSKAMTSPCGKIRIPINEEGNEKAGQIQEYLDKYQGEGIQHIAMGSNDLFATVDALRASGVKLLDTIDTYYELVDKRIPGHGESVADLKKRKILVDGKKGALLLQIFSENQLGPIFFEFIQRKGDDGFGEGNFKALFESIELDQMRRGVLAGKRRAHNKAPIDPPLHGDCHVLRLKSQPPGRARPRFGFLLACAGASAQTVVSVLPASSLDAVQKAGVLRICTPGDYKPFSFQKPDGTFEGIDVDLMASLTASLGVKPEYIKTSWSNLMPDMTAGKCDMAVGGISVTTERQKKAFFSAPYMVNGKTPIARCADVAKYQTWPTSTSRRRA